MAGADGSGGGTTSVASTREDNSVTHSLSMASASSNCCTRAYNDAPACVAQVTCGSMSSWSRTAIASRSVDRAARPKRVSRLLNAFPHGCCCVPVRGTYKERACLSS